MRKSMALARAMARLSTDRGHPSNGVPSGLAMSQVMPPMRAPLASGQGSTWKVSRSGFRYMSDSSIRTNPSIDEPSNITPPSRAWAN